MNTQITVEELLNSGQQALENVTELTNRVEALESVITELRSNNTDDGWVTLSLAAERVGISQAALRQRIRAFKYPEGKVWKQTHEKGAIFVNIAQLRECL